MSTRDKRILLLKVKTNTAESKAVPGRTKRSSFVFDATSRGGWIGPEVF